MSSAVDIQIVSTPNLEKIENFLKDSSYRETIEFSANFNTRLCIERRLRLPFIDPQTGVAQNHSNLFVNKRQRMPGFRQGQIYTYPAQRWRKSRRQYLNKMYRFPDRPFQALRKDHDALLGSTAVAGTASPIVGTASLGLVNPDFNGALLEESSSLGAFGGDTSDSKDSQQQPQTQLQPQQPQQPPQQQQLKEELPKDWYFDDIDINDVDSLEEPKSPADDEYDYDPRYGSKKRRKRRPGKRATLTPGEGGTSRRRSGAGRGRSSAAATAAAVTIADTSLTGSDVIDGSGAPNTEASTPTTSGNSRRSRGSGTRGRRRTKAAVAATCDPPSPGLNSEPPSFEMAAAAVGVISDLPVAPDEHADLRNYRKYL